MDMTCVDFCHYICINGILLMQFDATSKSELNALMSLKSVVVVNGL